MLGEGGCVAAHSNSIGASELRRGEPCAICAIGAGGHDGDGLGGGVGGGVVDDRTDAE